MDPEQLEREDAAEGVLALMGNRPHALANGAQIPLESSALKIGPSTGSPSGSYGEIKVPPATTRLTLMAETPFGSLPSRDVKPHSAFSERKDHFATTASPPSILPPYSSDALTQVSLNSPSQSAAAMMASTNGTVGSSHHHLHNLPTFVSSTSPAPSSNSSSPIPQPVKMDIDHRDEDVEDHSAGATTQHPATSSTPKHPTLGGESMEFTSSLSDMSTDSLASDPRFAILYKLKVGELRTLLSNRDQNATGSKDTLVKRLAVALVGGAAAVSGGTPASGGAAGAGGAPRRKRRRRLAGEAGGAPGGEGVPLATAPPGSSFVGNSSALFGLAGPSGGFGAAGPMGGTSSGLMSPSGGSLTNFALAGLGGASTGSLGSIPSISSLLLGPSGSGDLAGEQQPSVDTATAPLPQVGEKRKAEDDTTSPSRKRARGPPPDSSAYGQGASAAGPAASSGAVPTRYARGKDIGTPSNVLFVDNLPDQANEMLLTMLFRCFPGYRGLTLGLDPETSNKVAHVRYAGENEAMIALKGLQNFKMTPTHAMYITFKRPDSALGQSSASPIAAQASVSLQAPLTASAPVSVPSPATS